MPAPTPYALSYDFTSFQSSNPTTPLPADKIEIEFNAIETTTDEIITNLGLIQRSDGALANNSVGQDQLQSSITIGVNPASDWETSTVYIANDTVYESNKVYRCLESHTSGTFSTDLTANKWTEILDFDQFISATEADLVLVESDLTATEADLVLVESDLTAVEADLSSVESDLTAVEADLVLVESDLTATEADLTAVEADLSSVESDLTVLSPTVQTVTSTSNAVTIDLSTGRVFSHTFTENTTFSFTNPDTTGNRCSFELYLTQDGTGRTATWPASVDWPNGIEPDVSTASEVNVLVFTTLDGGTTWYGALAMEALS